MVAIEAPAVGTAEGKALGAILGTTDGASVDGVTGITTASEQKDSALTPLKEQ